MMSESVTVTVQDSSRSGAPKPGETGQGGLFTGFVFNPLYYRTIPGYIKIAQLILGLICIICGSPGYGASYWFVFVAITAFCITFLWVLIYLFSVREGLRIPINWILTELINTALYTFLYFTAFIAELASAWHARYIVAGVFGIFNTLAYAAGTYFLYLEHKNNQQ